MSNLVININGIEFENWTSFHLHRSMNKITGSFAASTSNFYRTEDSMFKMKMGDSCEIKIDNNVVLTGFLDVIDISYSDNYDTMEIRGWDNTVDLIDCSNDGIMEWKGQTVENLVKNLCLPFSIPVITDGSVTSEASIIIDSFLANEGQSVHEIIAELCRMNGIMPLCLGDGNITLSRATVSNSAFDSIDDEVNVNKGRELLNNRNRYSIYKIKGQGLGNDNKTNLADFVSPMGVFSDDIMNRTRPLVIFAETPTDQGQCQKRAKWEARIRAGLSRILEYEINGWTQTTGNLWEINMLVNVYDTFLNINDIFLISSIDYFYDEDNGEYTLLTLVNKDTYSLSDNAILIKTSFDE